MPDLKSKKTYIATVATVLLALSMQPSFASSDDAWKEFKQDVKKACIKTASANMKVKATKVDPFGSETYGYAIINGFEKGNKTEQQVICVYDKKSKKVEISGFFKK